MAGGAPELRLFSFRQAPSPVKVRVALAELGIEYDLIEVDLFRGEHTDRRFAKRRQRRKAPCFPSPGC